MKIKFAKITSNLYINPLSIHAIYQRDSTRHDKIQGEQDICIFYGPETQSFTIWDTTVEKIVDIVEKAILECVTDPNISNEWSTIRAIDSIPLTQDTVPQATVPQDIDKTRHLKKSL